MIANAIVGSTLGGVYRVLDLVGQGGFADVYLARHVRSNTIVAIKVLHHRFTRDLGVVQRFLREADLAQVLSEPHIVRVLDAAEDAGTYYIVMEYVEGHTLAQVLRSRGPLQWEEAVDLACQTLQALEAAHAAGIVHRDIKPQNLMLTPGGVLKVMDFGIARDIAMESATQSGIFLGTPKYMSPEQATGGAVDARSDLYSLGLTMFEVLVGWPPFEAETPMKTLELQVHAPPPRVGKYRHDVPTQLELVVERALQKDPDLRFQSAQGMREALIACLRSEATRLPAAWSVSAGLGVHHTDSDLEAHDYEDDWQDRRAGSPRAAGAVWESKDPRQGLPVGPASGKGGKPLAAWVRSGLRFLSVALFLAVSAYLLSGRLGPWHREVAPALSGAITRMREEAGRLAAPAILRPPSDAARAAPAMRDLVRIVPENGEGLVLAWTGEHSAQAPALAFSPDGRMLATSYGDRSLKLWTVADAGQARFLTGHRSPVRSVVFSPDGRLLASGAGDLAVKLWDVASGREMRTLSGHLDWVRSVAFSPDGQMLASAADDRTVKLWDVASGRLLYTLAGHGAQVSCVAFSPDGQMVASGSLDRTVRLWAVATGQEVGTWSGHTDQVWSIAFSPDGQLLASGSLDRTVKLWSVADGQEVRTLKGHEGLVSGVGFSPDGRLLASGSFDQTVKLWDVASGREVRTLDQGGQVSSVGFSPDGLLLAAASGDGTVKLWGVGR